jgi:hypothetical protein
MFPADRSSVILLCNRNIDTPESMFAFVMGIRSILRTGM